MAEKVSSVEKALTILDCFDADRPELSLAQLCRLLNAPKSTTLNQLRTLESMGYLFRAENTQNYRLGYKIMQLNYHARASLPIVQYAARVMEDLKEKCGTNVYLTSHINGRVFYVDCAYQNRRSIAYSDAGKTLPMHCTSCGKAMLSYMPESQVRAIIDKWGMKRSTEHTCTDYSALLEDLRICRERGYAIDDEEESVGVRCVAAAIRTSSGEVAGALSISGSAVHMTDEAVAEKSKILINAAAELMPYAQLFPAIQLSY